MSFAISITADTYQALRDKLREILDGGLPPVDFDKFPLPTTADEDTEAQVVRQRRGRPKKAAAPTVQSGSASENSPAGADNASPSGQQESQPAPVLSEAVALNVDGVRAALNSVIAAKGMPAAVAILKPFGTTRMADIKPEQYAAVMTACGKALLA